MQLFAAVAVAISRAVGASEGVDIETHTLTAGGYLRPPRVMR